MNIVIAIVCTVGIISSVIFGCLFFDVRKRNLQFAARFKDVIDADAELEKVNIQKLEADKQLQQIKNVLSLENEEIRLKQDISSLNASIFDLRKSYSEKHDLYDKLLNEIKIYEEDLETIEYGMHAPTFEFDSSERYKMKITEIRDRQKEMIKEKTAVHAKTDWVVGNSKVEGRKMIMRIVKLALRSFNGECDAAIANVRWNNFTQMETRIQKSRDAINELCAWSGCYITSEYFELKLEELNNVYLYAEKKQSEKEEQRAAAERIREEERAQREFEKAQRDAEKEEERYNAALEQAKHDLENAHGERVNKLNDKIAELQARLLEAQKNKARAVSMAQQTKSGHVYVISNIGSFGENVYKIGMTRRLDPTERVKELGDASVPFNFDIHAMIYSENAPKLENELHKKFWANRVNYVNDRREFFRVDLEEIEKVAHENNADVEFIKIPEAKEYRETLSIKAAKEAKTEEENQTEAIPEAI